MSVQVDDAFVREVMKRSMAYQKNPRATDEEMFRAATEIILAVAAERGMIVPEGAVNAWGIKDEYGTISTIRRLKRAAESARTKGETVVRVAVVEIKE